MAFRKVSWKNQAIRIFIGISMAPKYTPALDQQKSSAIHRIRAREEVCLTQARWWRCDNITLVVPKIEAPFPNLQDINALHPLKCLSYSQAINNGFSFPISSKV